LYLNFSRKKNTFFSLHSNISDFENSEKGFGKSDISETIFENIEKGQNGIYSINRLNGIKRCD